MASYHTTIRASTAASQPSSSQSTSTEPDVEKGCDYSNLTFEEKRQKPWQHYGYPALTQWMASANDFFMLRRFSPLQVRCLLYLQHQIAEKNRQLREYDERARGQPLGYGNSGRINEDPIALGDYHGNSTNPRPHLLQELIPLLQQYNDLVHSFSNMKTKSTASKHQIQNLDNWFETFGENAISKDEKHYRNNGGDLITMRSEPKYPIVALLHRSNFIRRCFALGRRDDRSEEKSTTYTSNTGLEAMATFIAISIGLAMTFGSIWALNAVSNTVYRLAIITVSGSTMTLIAWLAAGNRPFEILATFAAYMAVLMIYRQIA